MNSKLASCNTKPIRTPKIPGIKSYDSIYNELEDIKESLSKLIAEKKQDEPEPEGITTQKAIEILTNQLNLN